MDTESAKRSSELKDVDDHRVVMRRRIALNLDNFRAVPDGFDARPSGADAPLTPSVRPFLSVIIPNYNGERLLPGVQAALQAQTFQDFEVIVVDDASSDGSVAWLEAEWTDARVIVNRRNGGFDVSCNTGAAASRGHVLVFLNSDAQPEAEWAAELVNAVCGDPAASIFASKVVLLDRPSTLHTTGDMIGVDGVALNRGVWEADLGQYDQHTDVFGGCGCALAVRAELWEALGGFDEDFWMYLEDVDFAFRAQLMGAKAVYVPDARVRHALTATAGGVLSSYFVGRNAIWILAKNMPTGLLVKNGARILAAQVTIAADALRNFRGAEARARLAGQLLGVLTLPRILRKRRAVQARRRISDEDLQKKLYG